MRDIKILTLSILAWFLCSSNAFSQYSASELFREYSRSTAANPVSEKPETAPTTITAPATSQSAPEVSAEPDAGVIANRAASILAPTADTITAAIDSTRLLDSLMREENRYHIPQSQYLFTRELEAQIRQGDSILKVLASEVPAYRGPREKSDILRYYARYDLMHHRVHPEQPNIPEHIDAEYPAANPLFMPLVFNVFKRDLSMYENKIIPKKEYSNQFVKKPQNIKAQQYVDSLRTQLMQSLETTQLHQFEYSINDLPAYERIEVMLEAKKPLMVENRPVLDIQPIGREVTHIRPEYTYWDVRGRLSAQMTQTYISKNWSSGGESNMSGLYSFYWKANYNDKKNIQFDNFIDWKIGFNTNSGDTLRGYNISTDQLQASSKLGIRAIENWYYSAQAEFITQTLTNYKTNTFTPKSSFLSPAKLFVSLGMDYKKRSKNGKHNLSLLMTPLTYRMNFLMDTIHFDAGSYGIKPGKRVGHEFGFKVTANYDWKISEDISWNSYLFYYSDFSYIDSEWKNTINFKVNRYLSTQLFIHTKLNDRNFDRERKSFVQLKEFLSFGVTYWW